MTVTQDYLRECLFYDSENGLFTWKARPIRHFRDDRSCNIFNALYSWKPAGGKVKNRYPRICIDQVSYFSHRLSWLYVYGSWPEEIDHIDGNVTNNRISNLRNVDRQGNNRNFKVRHDNKTGVIGVYFRKNPDRWISRINDNGPVYLGCFDNLLDAASARKSAENTLEYHTNHGSR